MLLSSSNMALEKYGRKVLPKQNNHPAGKKPAESWQQTGQHTLATEHSNITSKVLAMEVQRTQFHHALKREVFLLKTSFYFLTSEDIQVERISKKVKTTKHTRSNWRSSLKINS